MSTSAAAEPTTGSSLPTSAALASRWVTSRCRARAAVPFMVAGMVESSLGQFPDPVAVAARGRLVELAEVGVQHRVRAHPPLQPRRGCGDRVQGAGEGAAQQPLPAVRAGQAEQADEGEHPEHVGQQEQQRPVGARDRGVQQQAAGDEHGGQPPGDHPFAERDVRVDLPQRRPRARRRERQREDHRLTGQQGGEERDAELHRIDHVPAAERRDDGDDQQDDRAA